MAGSSAVTFLFSYSSSLVSVFRTRCGEASADCYPSWFPTSVSLAACFRRAIRFSSPDHRRRRRRRVTIARKSGRDDEGEPFVWDDRFGTYPWDPSFAADEGIQWVQGDRITLFTSEGLVQIGGSLIPRRVSSHDKNKARRGASQRLQRFQESDYMDPDQKLCLGALFDIAATNGLDTGRRLCIYGFCRSIEMLSDVVEDAVLEHGGEVVAAEKLSRGGLQEKLTMIVAVPRLWGVPPASDRLRTAVRSGGGIVEKVYWQWYFL